MKIRCKYLVIIYIVSEIFIGYMGTKKEVIIEYKVNPNLPILKNEWDGNIMINDEFHNDSVQEKPPLLDVIKWKLSRNPQRKEKKSDNFKLPYFPIKSLTHVEDKLIWLGHSSFLITINNVTLITDPCFFDLPVSKRKVSIPCDVNNLNSINYLLVSHDHRDHFDKKSVSTIVKNNPKIEALLPLNASLLFDTDNLASILKQEAGWYQEYNISTDIRIVFLPTRHWGRRGLFDFNKTLWGSFLIIHGNKKIFFGGDTAYDDKMFKEIQLEFGDIDVCLLPIGAYSPSYIMKSSHATPEEAFKIFNDLGGKLFIPMHYGTYDLSDEPLGEPIKRLEECFNNKKDRKRFKKLGVGEEFLFDEI